MGKGIGFKQYEIIVLFALLGIWISLFDCSAAAASTTQPPRRRPNILLLITDDQDVVLGSFDHMPNAQQWIVGGGATFKNAFVHTPICCPSRSSILTGRYLHNGAARNNSLTGNCYSHAWRHNVEPHSYARHAQEAGYQTAYAGKYLNQYGTKAANVTQVPPGWDHWFGLVGNSRYYNYSAIRSDDNGKTVKVEHYNDTYEKDYLPDVLKNYAMDLLRHHFLDHGSSDDSVGKPWLLVVSWPTPHAPFTPAPWAEGRFAGTVAPRTTNYNASSPSMQQKHWLLRQLHPLDATVAEEIDRIYASRLEALMSVDEHVAEFMNLLKGAQHRNDDDDDEPTATSVLDSTITMYTSDHGFQFGQHRLAIDKRHLYEHDIRVPFAIRGPGIPASTELDKLILNIDIAPTIFDIVHNYQYYQSQQQVPQSAKSKDNNSVRYLQHKPIPDDMDGASFWLYVTSTTKDSVVDERDPFLKRRDFLVSYNGEGSLQCGLADCPLPQPPEVWYMPDSYNNTYHCVRTLDAREDTMYCQFEDDERFVEFYNLTDNPWQLDNDYYSQLSVKQRQYYAQRLLELRSCRGPTCRSSDNIKDKNVRYNDEAFSQSRL